MTEDKPHILMVDDDEEICALTAEYLQQHGFDVSLAHNAKGALEIVEQGNIALIILDIMLPGESGTSLCKRIHADHNIPIIMLTAIAEDTEVVVTLELGADDYLTKPFNLRILLARVRALLRRSQSGGKEEKRQSETISVAREYLIFAGWRFDLTTHQLLSPDNVTVELSSAERDLLLVFLNHPQRVLSREQLLDLTKRQVSGPFDRSIDVLISRVRQKIEADARHPEFIKTMRNLGYLFDANVVKESSQA